MYMEYVLETRGLTKRYGNHAAAQNINIHIRKGEIYGLIGRNGAGKTTIMRVISGLANPTSGDYMLFGKSGSEMGKLRRKVGVLIESPGLYPHLSAQENLRLKCLGMGVKPSDNIEPLLQLVGLGGIDKRKQAGSFSLGMRQRLGVALALVGNPEIIILDEPINGLDPQGIAEVRTMLEKLRDERGMTIMVSSHILDELAKIADSYGIIHEGRLLDEFTAEVLQERCGQSIAIRTGNNEGAVEVLKDLGLKKITIAHDGFIRVGENLDRSASMAKAIVEAGIPLHEIYVRNISLEDYYLRMTGGKQDA